MQHLVEPPGAASPVDDCWNRIGTRGDRSCPRLAQHLRCLNCPVFAQAAAVLLDRPFDPAETALPITGAQAAPNEHAPAESAVVFRIAGEWLALPTGALRHADELRRIHSLPHRRGRVVLGVVNVRGVLTLAASLAELLHIEQPRDEAPAPHGRAARMLVAAWQGEPVALPVDEVEGVVRYDLPELLPVPATLARATAQHTRGVLPWRGRAVGVLDAGALFESLARSFQ